MAFTRWLIHHNAIVGSRHVTNPNKFGKSKKFNFLSLDNLISDQCCAECIPWNSWIRVIGALVSRSRYSCLFSWCLFSQKFVSDDDFLISFLAMSVFSRIVSLDICFSVMIVFSWCLFSMFVSSDVCFCRCVFLQMFVSVDVCFYICLFLLMCVFTNVCFYW